MAKASKKATERKRGISKKSLDKNNERKTRSSNSEHENKEKDKNSSSESENEENFEQVAPEVGTSDRDHDKKLSLESRSKMENKKRKHSTSNAEEVCQSQQQLLYRKVRLFCQIFCIL